MGVGVCVCACSQAFYQQNRATKSMQDRFFHTVRNIIGGKKVDAIVGDFLEEPISPFLPDFTNFFHFEQKKTG